MAEELGDYVIPTPHSSADVIELGRQLRSELHSKSVQTDRKHAAIAKVDDKYNPAINMHDARAKAIADVMANYMRNNNITETLDLGIVVITPTQDGTGSVTYLVEEQKLVDRLEKMGADDCVKVEKTVKKSVLKANLPLMSRLRRYVTLTFKPTYQITVKPTRPQEKRGHKAVTYSVPQ